MEHKQFESIQGWFEILNRKVDECATGEQLSRVEGKIDGVEKRLDEVEKRLVLKIENRFQVLAVSIANLAKKIEDYRDQQNEEISILRHALRDLEREVKELHQIVHS